jgi:hypothetical protein
MSTAISLCIPRVFNNITESKVYNVFNKLNIGKIHSINMIVRTNKKNKMVKCVFINFDYWYLNEQSQMRNQLLSGKEIKIVYDDPWFWNVSIKRSTNVSTNVRTNKPLDIAPGLINIASDNIAPCLPKIYKELEDNPDIYADDEKMIERMKPINYSLIDIPAPKKRNLKIRK